MDDYGNVDIYLKFRIHRLEKEKYFFVPAHLTYQLLVVYSMYPSSRRPPALLAQSNSYKLSIRMARLDPQQTAPFLRH